MAVFETFNNFCRQSSENSPSRTAPASFRTKLGNRSLLPRPPAKSNSPLNTTDSVLDEPSSQVQRLPGSANFFNDNCGHHRRRFSQLESAESSNLAHSAFFSNNGRRSSTLTQSRDSFRKSTASIKRKLFCRSETSNGSATFVNKPLECNPELSKRLSEYSEYLVYHVMGTNK